MVCRSTPCLTRESLTRMRLQETEAYVSRLVNSKMIFAKIDRLAGIVNFTPVKVRAGGGKETTRRGSQYVDYGYRSAKCFRL